MKTLKNYLINLGKGGTATLNINKTSFENINLLIPNKELLNKFHILIEANFNIILNNQVQIQTLQQTRDTLLPKLINREFEVDELDIRGIE